MLTGLPGDRDRVDFNKHFAARQAGENRGAAGKDGAAGIRGHELAVRVVHRSEVLALGEVNPQHYHVVEARTARVDDRLDVLQRARGLGRDISRIQVLVRRRVDRSLSGDLHERSFSDALGEGVRRGGGIRGGHGDLVGHVEPFMFYAAGDQPSSSEMASAAART